MSGLKQPKLQTPMRRAMDAAKRTLRRVAFFSFFVNLLTLTSSIYMLQVYDRVLASRSQSTLLYLTLFAAACLATLAVLEMVRSRLLVRMGARFDAQLSGQVFAQVISSGRSGQPFRDLDSLRTFLTGAHILSLLDAPWMPIYIGLVYVLHPMLGHVALVGGVLLFALALWNERATRKPLSEAGGELAASHQFAEHSARNAEAVRAMGMLPGLAAIWRKRHDLGLGLQGLASDAAGSIAAVAKAMRFFSAGCHSRCWCLAGDSARNHCRGHDCGVHHHGTRARPGGVGDRRLARLSAGARGARASGEGLWRCARACGGDVVARAKRGGAVRQCRRWSARDHEADHPRPQFHPRGWHLPRYHRAQCSGQVDPGATGDRSVAADEWCGAPRWREYRRLAARRCGAVHWLPASGHRAFPGTVADNIARFGEVDPQQVVDAAQLAGAHQVILDLPKGYDTLIGPSGANLSGGQRQRIGLARAFYRRPALIVLDEPTSNLDAEGEAAVRQAMDALHAQGRTVIVIAHRPAVLGGTDKLMVVVDGQVAAFGPTTEVMPNITRRVASRPEPVVALAHAAGAANV